MLRAKGIPYTAGQRGAMHSLWVNDSMLSEALGELCSYESENSNWPPAAEPAPAMAPYAHQGSAVYAALLISIYLLAGESAWGFEWKSLGAAHAQSILHGEPWRATTALFLHADVPHVLSNLVFGLFFGYLVAIGHGGGLGWFAILLAGSLGNLGNALIQDPSHLSIGASTAVFAALGVLAGSEWRRRFLLRQGRLRLAAPVVLAVTAFAMHGVPRQAGNVDVGAHATGLMAGLLVGVALPYLLARGLGSPRAQKIWALAALLGVGMAWWLALAP